MRKKAKRKDDDYSSDDSDKPPPKKTAKKKSDIADDDNPDDVLICEMANNRRVSVRTWQGKIMVDIRQFYVKDGKQLPGKKGISLSMDQWTTLRDHAEEIDKVVAEKS